LIWRALYAATLYALLPFVLLRLWWRGRKEPGYRRRIAERFGWYRFAPERAVLWVHAVSVGEARASAPLVRALLHEFSGHELLVSCSTATGRDTLKQLYGESVSIAWLPYDYPGAVRRFIEHFRPRIGVLMETEIWPNLLAACGALGVPVVLASARMSERSARGYARWSLLMRPAFASLAAACAQSDADGARLAALGATAVSVCGNLKFDLSPDAAQVDAGRAWRASIGRPVAVLASTREGEEKLLLDAFASSSSSALAVFVPRHPQRFDAVADLIGSAVRRRGRAQEPAPGDRYFLGDTMGEMAFYYGASDVAIIGGSFLPLGGQNLIEASAVGTPVIFGPSMHNFAEASALALAAGAAVQAQDAAHAVRLANELLQDPTRREAMRAAGLRLCATHRGAVQKHIAICKKLLEGR
jgi:3-deoxy-D-manno-octulosonic-acid transferase